MDITGQIGFIAAFSLGPVLGTAGDGATMAGAVAAGAGATGMIVAGAVAVDMDIDMVPKVAIEEVRLSLADRLAAL
jgi:hypothetical protein